ncbi:hypothetical protein FLL45_15350 [Aliikangiella marina]|uniref:Bacterial Pleckstrin homology domain-containing protein n=1 Tax=Aliikangiella marina TaxID=1712262 RepID=A0A545T6I3_9GAMM|nr:PH domain-containing protein [Aliikangiella marina]TQV72840.1 hypothetical protein FLL45_15350 [Aliikangiella marina]
MHYQAPFGRATLLITLFSSLLMVALPIVLLVLIPVALFSLAAISLMIPIAILLACFWYRVTGYQLDSRELTIKRLVFDFIIPLDEIESVEFDQTAMKRSLRMFGNGGLFGFYGYFRNDRYGSFRAFVTDSQNVVVIKTSEKIFMVSPDKPEKFVNKLNDLLAKKNAKK